MKAVVGVLLMLFRVSQGVDPYCDGRQDGAHCYGALGEAVDLRLVDNVSEIHRINWKKNGSNIFTWRDNNIIPSTKESRFLFFSSNGTVRINNLSRNDSGEYKLEIYDENGKSSAQRTLQLFVQGVEPYCDGRQDGAQCYGALGGAVDLLLMDNISEVPRFQWKKNGSQLFRWRVNNIIPSTKESRFLFFPSKGTVRINNLSRNNSGEYELEIYDENGKSSAQRTLQLFVQAVEPYCDGRQDGAQCYGALGGAVDLLLMDNVSEIPRFNWKKNGSNIFTWRDNNIIPSTKESRFLFFPSKGTVRIHNLSRNDSGEYELEIHDKNGKSSAQRTLQLFVQGVEPYCDGRQDGAQCYGALGGAVDLRLMDNVSEVPRFNWKKDSSNIFTWRDNNMISSTKESRFLFFPSNGTVRINNLSRNDSGEYKLEIYDKNGLRLAQRTLQLFVQAPVSSVQLVSECVSQGKIKVSCLSEGGDSPQYDWTLDGHTLTDSELFSRNNETNIIFLRQNISGRLVCSVKNKVSDSFKEMKISDYGCIFINCTSNGIQISKWVHKENNILCVEPTTVPVVGLLPVMAGVLTALVIVLIVCITFICAHKKKKNVKVEEDDQELTYADVRIVKKQERKVEQSVEVDVEYGKIKFSKRPRQDQSKSTVDDDTVYAQVCKGR
ncbi:contactin-1-like isoform X3 [Fundulus heteroclitus]|uniref:contactin-1-like isoform X3 n=1 Tax=Fundulus heteroclitus TaxID=8078 RepID=UPI00165A739A|nr:contactin-1-like isoform X3 [Fundulus heteroclitus]